MNRFPEASAKPSRTRALIRPETRAAALAAAVCALVALGCTPSSERQQHGPRVMGGSAQAENFDRALDLLDGSLEFGTDEAYLRASFFVNEWLAAQDRAGWRPDPVLESLPKSLSELPEVKSLATLEVDTEDMRYLEAALIARQLGDWIVKGETPPLTSDWLEQADDLSPQEKLDLANAVKLFDWTTRNIYLQQVRRRPDAAAGQRVESWVGDWMTTRDVLLYGQGDSWQRARVFLELCRQQGLGGVVLACAPQGVRPAEASEDLTPWAVAIPIAERLYLFDPALGLPVPGPGGAGVATLTQAAEDPGVLEYLNVGQQHRYPIGPAEIQRVYALVDASPEAAFPANEVDRGAFDRKTSRDLVRFGRANGGPLEGPPSLERRVPLAAGAGVQCGPSQRAPRHATQSTAWF